MFKRTKSKAGHAGKDRRQSSRCSTDRSSSGDLLSDSSGANSPSSFSGSDGQLYWDISLDADLLQTIINFYPEWFADYFMADESLPTDLTDSLGSPRAVVDEASIQKAMDKNKESLKVKLLLRRPIGQLVEQGILPPVKASPEFYERSKKLERARMEDFLKRQIQRRPDRQSLIEQHILEDTFVSPSLQGAERQLKKVRLADDLNDRLSHRPGPLELVKGNILLADERLSQAIKEGALQFKATCEGEPVKHPPPLFHLEDPESSSDGTRSPPQDLSDASITSFSPADVHAVATHSAATDATPNPSSSGRLICSAAPSTTFSASPPTTGLQTQPLSLSSSVCSLQPSKLSTHDSVNFSVAASPFTATAASPALTSPPSASVLLATTADNSSALKSSSFTPGTASSTASPKACSSSLAAKSRKKCKSKIQPKTRTIKFHEYKGPPSAQKSNGASAASRPSESSYELLLKQQQLFLQWQLEWQQKYPHIIMPSNAQKQVQEQPHQDPGSNGMSPGSHQTVLMSNVGSKGPPAEATVSTAKNNANQSNNNSVQNAGSGCNTTGSNNKNNTNPVPSYQNTASATPKLISRLEDLKVSDLKVQLKKRSLPVSGSKPQLLERLKPFASEVLAALRLTVSSSSSCSDPNDTRSPKSSVSPSPSSSSSGDNQPKCIETAGEKAAEVNASADVAMDVGESMQGNNNIHVSSHFTAASEKLSLSAAPQFINNSFIINNKDMIKLHQEHLENQAKVQQQQQQQYPVQGQQQQQIQLQLQYPIFQTQGPSIAIPLASIATPQFQVITSVAQNQSSSHFATPSSSARPAQEPAHHQVQRRKSANVCGSFENSRPSSSAAVKASLAAFLQNQAAQQQTSLISEPFGMSDMSYPHVVLFPPHQPMPTATKQQRAHSFSLPADTTCHLASSSRTGSLPSFPIARRLDKSAVSSPRPPPPNYEEATKVTAKPAKRVGKKNLKSQALEDVLEILVSSGELPASAADEPETPTTPSCKARTGSHPSQQAMFASEPADDSLKVRIVKAETKPTEAVCQPQQGSDTGLDLDLILNLQALDETMDFGQDGDRGSGSSWLNQAVNSDSLALKHHAHDRRVSSGDQTCAMSLGWMEVSPSDANDWISELNLSVDNEHKLTDHKLTDHKSRQVPSNDFNYCINSYNSKNNVPLDPRSLFRPNPSPVATYTTSAAKDHDPILPNNMLGTVPNNEPLLDLFFDENEMRAHELGVWDRLDFAA